jgi:hypothetical protein
MAGTNEDASPTMQIVGAAHKSFSYPFPNRWNRANKETRGPLTTNT